MKICWDNLEKIHFTVHGNFRCVETQITYVERSSCLYCGDPYLTIKSKQSNFCSKSCAQSGEYNIWYNKKLSYEHKIQLARKPFGGASFSTHANKISYAEEIRRCPDNEKLLQVRCTYCGKWFTPKRRDVLCRVEALNSERCGEGRLYCSDNCKLSCPTFNRSKYPKGFKPTTSREVQPELRQLVLARDDYTCQKCGKTVDEIQIHCHHITGIKQNPIESADMDNCITLCKDCHKWVHKQSGCKYYELGCKEI